MQMFSLERYIPADEMSPLTDKSICDRVNIQKKEQIR